jgi:D-xylonolactonase
VACWFGNGICRYDPDGKLERKIELPVAQPSSLTFGGPEMNEIYITSAAVQWESNLAPVNHDFSTPRGGSVYRFIQDIQGKPEFKANV